MIPFMLAQSALCACIALALMLRDVKRSIEADDRHAIAEPPLLSAPLAFKEACEKHSPPRSSTSSPVAVVGLAMVAAWLLGMFFGLSEVVAAVLLLACWGVSTSLIRCAVGPSDAS